MGGESKRRLSLAGRCSQVSDNAIWIMHEANDTGPTKQEQRQIKGKGNPRRWAISGLSGASWLASSGWRRG